MGAVRSLTELEGRGLELTVPVPLPVPFPVLLTASFQDEPHTLAFSKCRLLIQRSFGKR